MAPSRSDGTEPIWRSTIRWLLASASWLLFIAVIAQSVLILWLGDAWWVGTVAMFAPRWPLLVPLAVVTAACFMWRRKLLWIQLASGSILLGPAMGLCVPLSLGSAGSDGFPIRVLTTNIGGGVENGLLREQIRAANPDIIAFQEFSPQLAENVVPPGWHWQTARGLAVSSRFPIVETNVFEGRRLGRYHDYGLRVRVRTPVGDAWICCVYLDSPRDGFSSLTVTRRGIFGVDEIRENTRQRGEQSRLVSQWVREVRGPAIIAGDMNQPAESYFHRRDWSFWRDAYAAVGFGYGQTWFSSWHGLRIDHILANEYWHVRNCLVVGAIGGDHRPVVADLVLQKK